MGRLETFQPAPPAAVSRVLATFDRDQLSGFIAVAIDLLDLADGDTDVEPNGDEEDSDGDERGDQAWIEWHTMRGSQKRGPNILVGHEDDEDNDPLEEDDPSGQCTEDEISYGVPTFGYGGPSGPGCPISDPGALQEGGYLDYGVDQSKPLPPEDSEDRALMKPHLRRIRAEACDKITRFCRVEYRLR